MRSGAINMKKGAVMIYPEFSMQEISCLTELFKFNDKEITVFASSLKPVNSEDGFTILPHKTFEEFEREEYDCVILPGIWDYRIPLKDDKNIVFLKQFVSDRDIVIASISSSPILLAKANILDDHKFCCGLFEEVIDKYEFIPRENMVRKPVNVDGNLVTAIGFAFREFAVEVAKKIGIKCSNNIFLGVTKEYTEEELTFHMPEEPEDSQGDLQMSQKILKTDSRNNDFTILIKLLDDDLNGRYGELQKQYDKHNKVDYINDVIIIYKDEVPVACGAFKEHTIDSIELKRIFVTKENRRQGLSKLIINELEQWGRDKGYKYALLETGKKQHEAINLYKSVGYETIENYEPYVGNKNSVCMKKSLK